MSNPSDPWFVPSPDEYASDLAKLYNEIADNAYSQTYNVHVPLSVLTGSRRKRFSWWLGGRREALAYRLAPWLRTGR